jgi:DNA-binding NarL/FixJ family response regulator
MGTDSEAPAIGVKADSVIAVAIIEDNRLVREGITALLNRFADMQVVAAESTGHEAILRRANPQVILLDLGLENGDSLRVARSVKEGFPDTRVIVMDLLPDEEDIKAFVSVGVSGFVMKDATLDELVHTIRSVVAGIDVLPLEVVGRLFTEIAREAASAGELEILDSVRMTSREREVIDLIAEGLSNKAIAKRLHISTHTVKSHLRNIMEKLNLHTRLELAVYAHERDTDT